MNIPRNLSHPDCRITTGESSKFCALEILARLQLAGEKSKHAKGEAPVNLKNNPHTQFHLDEISRHLKTNDPMECIGSIETLYFYITSKAKIDEKRKRDILDEMHNISREDHLEFNKILLPDHREYLSQVFKFGK